MPVVADSEAVDSEAAAAAATPSEVVDSEACPEHVVVGSAADSEAVAVATSAAAAGSRTGSDSEVLAPPKLRSSRLADSEPLTLLAALATRPWVVDFEADSAAAEAAADSGARSEPEAVEAVATSAARVRSRVAEAGLASPAAEAACPAHAADSEAVVPDSKAGSDLETSAPPKVRSSRLADSEPLTLLTALAMRPWVDSEADSAAAAADSGARSGP
jgi:hypothetical protein